MKKVLLIITIAGFFIGCNMNPSKEARIQKLEAEIQMTIHKVNELESRVQTLEVLNAQLKTRIHELEKMATN